MPPAPIISIRRAITADIPDLILMLRETWLLDAGDDLPAADRALLLEQAADPARLRADLAHTHGHTHDTLYDVAEVEGAVLGVITITITTATSTTTDTNATSAEIHWLHVLQIGRRMGLGRRLVEHALATLPLHIRALSVVTHQDATPLRAFYQHLGFREMESFERTMTHGAASSTWRVTRLQITLPPRDASPVDTDSAS